MSVLAEEAADASAPAGEPERPHRRARRVMWVLRPIVWAVAVTVGVTIILFVWNKFPVEIVAISPSSRA